MSDKYLNMDIDDPRASAIAEVMSNKTSKKILSLIAEKEVTGSDIANELNLPLNTVGYNLDKLLKAGLIETSKNFFWSSKGKKMPTYKLSNKKILISPKKMIPSGVLAVFGTIIGILLLFVIISSIQNHNGSLAQNQTNLNVPSNVKNFNSMDELSSYIKSNSVQSNYDLYSRGGSDVAMVADAAAPAALGANEAKSSSAGSYSQTNVQVEGVDEPDILKNDGKYIYAVSGNKIVIVDAYPAEEMYNVSSIELSESISGIFLNNDKLIVFSQGYQNYASGSSDGISVDVASSKMIAPCRFGGCGGGTSLTNIYVYDIRDKEKPVIEGNFSIEGNYVSARMIGNYVYLVSSKSAYLQNPIPPIYYMNGVKSETSASDVMYYQGYEDNSFSFTSIVSLNLENQDINKKVYLTGYTSTVYVSEDGIYLTYSKRMNYNNYNEKLLNEAIIPSLPSDLIEKTDSFMNSDKEVSEKYAQVMNLVYTYSNSLTGKEKEKFDSDLQKSMNDFSNKISKEYEKTVIMKVGINEGEIELLASGEVMGSLLNQFSMDAYNDDFRIATTTGTTWEGNSLNHLFVLDKDMKVVGSIEDLAEGERIYSVRFMGERAYIVTFKNVDPLYVIDLSDSQKPKVLGYLKIPGYSDYLHPYDSTHIIGIGKEVNESIDSDKVHSAGAVYYTAVGGVKVSIFDVSDFEHPIESAKIVIGERGSDSYALTDHKAVLFNKEKHLLVLPITVNEIRNSSYSWNGEVYEESYPIFQGAYVFDITADSIKVRGKVTHINDSVSANGPAKDEPVDSIRKDYDGNVWKKIAINAWKSESKGHEYDTYYDYQIDSFPDGYNSYQNRIYDYRTQIQRTLFMDDVLYTVSQSKVKANSLDSLNDINEIDISSNENYYGYPILY